MQPEITDTEIASFGAVHLGVRSVEKSTLFWTKIAGMVVRNSGNGYTELGTNSQTLVVLEETAGSPFKNGFSGLYHFAVHAANKETFAKILYRILANNYPCSPTDHTMSKAVYLNDPDGITIEFTLETPQRLKRIVTHAGLKAEDIDGTIRAVSAPLDVDAVFADLKDKDLSTPLPDDTKIGHIHFYAMDLEESYRFYEKLGFLKFNFFPEYLFGDLGAGGAFQHRIALNCWHGIHKPLAPEYQAGLKYYEIIFSSKEQLLEALGRINNYETKDDGYWLKDPSGIEILLRWG